MVKTGGNPQSIRLCRLFFCELHTLRRNWEIEQVLDRFGLMNQINKEELIDKFIYELPILRARVDMTQDEVSAMAGLSRQTYSALETRKRKMTWSNFMALLFIFYYNPVTRDEIESSGVFPEELRIIMRTDHRSNGGC